MGEWQPTVSEAVQSYLRDAEMEGRPPKSVATYRSSLRTLADNDAPVLSLARDARDLLSERLRGLAPNSIGGVIAAWRSFVTYCLSRGWLVADPLIGIKPPRKRETVHRYLSSDELRRVYEAADCALDQAAILLLAMGLRAGEACGVRWRDFSETDEGPALTVRTEKNGEPRILPVSARLSAVLDELPRDTVTVLGIGTHRIWERVARLGRRAGVPIYPHMLRHTWAMGWVEATGDLGNLQTLGGWKSATMSRHYARSALQRQALKKARAVNLDLFGDD